MTEREKWIKKISKAKIESEKDFYEVKNYIFFLETALNDEYKAFQRNCPHEEFEWVSGLVAEDIRGYFCCKCGLSAGKYRGPRPLKIKGD